MLNTNRRENSESTFENARLENFAITSQVTRKLNELKRDLNTQILDSINSAMNEKVFPAIQNTICSQMNGFGGNVTTGPVDKTVKTPEKLGQFTQSQMET